MKNRYTPLRLLVASAFALLLAACASIGNPSGGPRDEVPPVFVRSLPAPGERNVNRTRLDLYFDENIKLDDAFNKVIVSPPQTNTPVVSANGRHLTVDLKDTLIPNTTYTIDFADAIQDLNEGNLLDAFAFDFATGPDIDSLRISGIVLEAKSLEPAQGMLVGAYSIDADSVVSTLRPDRVTRTNQLGQFTIRNLKPGSYRVYAINDINRDYRWDRSEDVAFLDCLVTPSAEPITVTDTLRSHDGGDSLVARQGTAYFPNDLLLSHFNEDYKSIYLKDNLRDERRKITIRFSAPVDTLPTLTILRGPDAGRIDTAWSLLRKNPGRDSLEYWITDPGVLATDSLQIALRYLRTDTADNVTWTTDTLDFVFRDPKNKKKKSEPADTVPKIEFISFSSALPTSHDVYRPLIFRSFEPIGSIAPDGYRLEALNDTTWSVIPDVKFVADSLDPLMQRNLSYNWTPGAKYRLTVDSAAVRNVYGKWNNRTVHEFTVKPLEEYTTVNFNVTGCDTLPMVAEILDRSDKVVAVRPVVDGRARFEFLPAGEFYARLYIDADSSGVWSTGNLASNLQPEEMYYYPKKIALKKNWEIDINWNIYDTPVDMQKPYAIKKNKPKLKKGEKAPNEDEDNEEDEDGFGRNPYDIENRGNRNNNRRGTNSGYRSTNLL